MAHIEFCEYIVEEQDDGKIEVFTEEKYLDLLECEEEDFIFSSGEKEGTLHTLGILS